MLELIEASIAAVNIIPTVLLSFVMIYWITVIVGVIDVDTLDFDLDMDLDADVDVDVDVDADVETDINVHGLSSVLAFFNIGHMPFMIFLSFLALPMWVMSVVVNFYLGNSSFLLSLVFLIPILIGSLFVAKILTTPIAKFYMKLRQEDEAVNPIGKPCKILLSVKGESMGQAEIMVNGTSILINAIASEGVELQKGESALVIEYIKDKNYYLIEPYKL